MKYVANYSDKDRNNIGVADLTYYLQVNSAGFYEFDEPFGAVHRPLGRKDWYLSYHHAGSMNIKSNGADYTINAGDIFLYKPGEEQYYGQIGDQSFKNYWVHFTGFGVTEIIAAAGLSDQSVFSIGPDSAVVNLYEQLIDELMFKKNKYNLISASILIQMIGYIGRLHVQSSTAADHNNIVVDKSLQAIHQQYQDQLSVGSLAALNHMSTSRFSALFRQQTGISPQQYIINFRLSKACELLRNSHLNIRQISILCGFSDQLYFSRIFKKHMYKSPKLWRDDNIPPS